MHCPARHRGETKHRSIGFEAKIYAQARSGQICLDHAESRSAHLQPRQDAYTSIAGRSKARMVLYFVPAAALSVLRGGHV